MGVFIYLLNFYHPSKDLQTYILKSHANNVHMGSCNLLSYEVSAVQKKLYCLILRPLAVHTSAVPKSVQQFFKGFLHLQKTLSHLFPALSQCALEYAFSGR